MRFDSGEVRRRVGQLKFVPDGRLPMSKESDRGRGAVFKPIVGIDGLRGGLTGSSTDQFDQHRDEKAAFQDPGEQLGM